MAVLDLRSPLLKVGALVRGHVVVVSDSFLLTPAEGFSPWIPFATPPPQFKAVTNASLKTLDCPMPPSVVQLISVTNPAVTYGNSASLNNP
jgi:hypothetical protein